MTLPPLRAEHRSPQETQILGLLGSKKKQIGNEFISQGDDENKTHEEIRGAVCRAGPRAGDGSSGVCGKRLCG